MGYTHYWGSENVDQEQWDEGLVHAVSIVNESMDILAGHDGEGKPSFEDGISFNGIDEQAHETFSVPANARALRDFEFCKTAHKDYDIVVVAVLSVLFYCAGPEFSVSSDGGINAWKDGVDLARSITKLDIKVPDSVPQD